MRRIAVVLAFTLVAASPGGAGAENVAVAQTPAKTSAALALVEAYNGSRLVWLNPATLRPLKRGSVELPGGVCCPVFSPASRFIALGGRSGAGIRIIDLKQMNLVARIARRPWSEVRNFQPLAWPERRRLLVLEAGGSRSQELLVVDPVARRVVARHSAGGWVDWARAGRKLVVLIAPEKGVESTRLMVLGPGGGVLGAKDVDIDAGTVFEEAREDEPRARVAQPGLAVDPAGRRAFVVDSQNVDQIDLSTLDVSYARLAEARSLTLRLLSWLEPTAQAKLISGWSRRATWLGEDLVAVSGSTYDGAESTPAGLRLVDTRTGAVRTLEPRASAHRSSQGVLLAFGSGRDSETDVSTGMGLAAFSPNGTELWSALGDQPVWWVETAGGYAYVPTPEERFPRGVRVIDLATGSVVRTVRRDLPAFVTRD